MSEYTTPSQAEGERDDEDMEDAHGKPLRESHPRTTRTTPSQAEGERENNSRNNARNQGR
ncbi:hypothetical protein AB0K09_29595 [Streptomyces sp. NPDC049577]|uniref:hypothetical protein n=1 Tax=Streptomyces sp. NPDC049577 TaxID=3155153 RepID=UPI0034355196